MFGTSTLKQLFTAILQTKFVTGVHHSVKIQSQEGIGKPVAPVNGKFIYVGIDDREGFTCYCRQTGPADVESVEKIGGCSKKKYRLQVPHRLVFYNQEETRDHDTITARLTAATMDVYLVKLQRVLTIPDDILRTESPTGRFTFRDNSFYIAIDFFVLLDVMADTCETEITCEGIDNPFCI